MASNSKVQPEIEELVNLKKDEELLLKVPSTVGTSRPLVFKLIDGAAELLGTELEPHKEYVFEAGSALSILSHKDGCVISIINGKQYKLSIADSSSTTTSKSLRNVHEFLENFRCLAKSENNRGPVVCLVGQTDTGKSTSCVTLLNYAVKCSRQPIYVDLDLGQGNLSLPGTFGAVIVNKPIEASKDFKHLEGNDHINYFVGSNNPGDNMHQHNLIASKFSKVLRDKLNENVEVKSAGMLINTCGWVEGAGYKVLTHIIEAFEVDYVLLMDVESSTLASRLGRDVPLTTNIVCIPRSELIVEKSQQFRKHARAERVLQYFYGRNDEIVLTSRSEITQAYKFQVQFSNVTILKLPEHSGPVDFSIIPPSRNLINHLFGVSKANKFTDENQDDILNVISYVCITNINMTSRTLTLLSHAGFGQPSFNGTVVLLLSNIKFPRSQTEVH